MLRYDVALIFLLIINISNVVATEKNDFPEYKQTKAGKYLSSKEAFDENDQEYNFTIVGEDEAEPDQGRIGWVSPLAKELLGKKPDDVLVWERPVGNLELEILKFRYKQNHADSISGTSVT